MWITSPGNVSPVQICRLGLWLLLLLWALSARAAPTPAIAPILMLLFENQSPSIEMTFPVAGDTIPAGDITLIASASDADGTISKVEFFVDTVSIGSAASAPYSITWPGVAAGTYTLLAKASDSAGQTSVSPLLAELVI